MSTSGVKKGQLLVLKHQKFIFVSMTVIKLIKKRLN